ncbi:MAG: hypothetical protein WCE79_24500 [Xanthobacteraceae bacterium]
MQLLLGLILTYPLAALVIACFIGLLIVWWIWSAGAPQRALKRETDAFLERLRTEEEQRRQLVTLRYEPEIASRILNREFWQGMTEEELRDSLGPPEGLDRVVTKRTNKEIWKYEQETTMRFGLRITLEDGVVTGWTQR